MKRKVLSLLALLMTAVTGAWAQNSPVAYGICGSNVTWELSLEFTLTSPEYTLTISGEGTMSNYSFHNSQPWNSYKADINNVKVGDGVTAIGENAFFGCTALTDVTIGSGVKTIGNEAFGRCTSLEEINIPDGVDMIRDGAFYDCSSLKTVNLPASLRSISQNLFKDCTSLEEIVIPAGVGSIGQNVIQGCTNLKVVTILSRDVLFIEPNAFRVGNLVANLVFYVPADSQTYQTLSNVGSTFLIMHVIPIPSTYTLSANEGKTGEFWATFYSNASNYQAAEGVQVFKVNLDGEDITMNEITDRIVNRGQGVVLKSTSGSSITMTQITSDSDDDYSGNSLKGTMTSITTTEENNYYVLNKGENGVGFYKLSANGEIGANKAYLTYSGSLAREFFSFNEATGISATLNDNAEMINDNVYDLQGRSVSQPTKGLYIVNGKKVIIK